MIVHDWTKVVAGIFHHLHHRWIAELCDSLNNGRLPDNYYAMAEQVAGSPRPDILALELASADDESVNPQTFDAGGFALAVAPPQVRYTLEAEGVICSRKQNRIAIYHTSRDNAAASIEIVSPGIKNSVSETRRLHRRIVQLLKAGKHFLMIDILPPGKHDPRGMHAAFWEYAYGDAQGVTAEEPFGAAAYRMEVSTEKLPEPMAFPTAYFEPFGRQGPLPTMPLFLTSEYYINVPLDETYAAAWSHVPRRWQQVIEDSSGA